MHCMCQQPQETGNPLTVSIVVLMHQIHIKNVRSQVIVKIHYLLSKKSEQQQHEESSATEGM